MRLGLLSRQKYCALVNNFGNRDSTCEELAGLGCVSITDEVIRRQKFDIKLPTAQAESATQDE
ncbi:MAG: hypothetical protein ACK56F_13490, partial [bacterium]